MKNMSNKKLKIIAILFISTINIWISCIWCYGLKTTIICRPEPRPEPRLEPNQQIIGKFLRKHQ